MTATPPSSTDQATPPACAGNIDDLLWFPHPGDEDYAATRAADLYCRTCPHATACLDQAVTDGMVGIWAGTTDRQRAALRRRRGITRRPSLTQTTTTDIEPAARARAIRQVQHLIAAGHSTNSATSTIATTIGVNSKTLRRWVTATP